MIKYTKQSIQSYLEELNTLDLIDFNRFIIKKILYKTVKIHTILPLLAAIGVLAFSLALQDSFYVFIPQSSITSFASYVVFACVTSLVVLIFYPLFMIIILNYLANQLRFVFKRMLLPIKLLILFLVFHMFIEIVSNTSVKEPLRVYLTFVWILFYFIMANFYLAYKANQNLLRLPRFKFGAIVLFLILFIKPFLLIFLYTSEMINYTAINPQMYVNSQNCQLLTTPVDNRVPESNMTISDTKYFESTASGCLLKGNLVRYGFSSDYVVIFKKNINPILSPKGVPYNAYVRLICYYGNTSCYSEDNNIIKVEHDSLAEMIHNSMLHHSSRMQLIDD